MLRSIGDFRMTVTAVEREVLVVLTGELDLSSAPALASSLIGLVAQGHTHLVLDVADLTFIDASGLGVLVRVAKAARAAGGRITLLSPQPQVRRLLSITGLSGGLLPDS
jgi:anti-anti-sigma factor